MVGFPKTRGGQSVCKYIHYNFQGCLFVQSVSEALKSIDPCQRASCCWENRSVFMLRCEDIILVAFWCDVFSQTLQQFRMWLHRQCEPVRTYNPILSSCSKVAGWLYLWKDFVKIKRAQLSCARSMTTIKILYQVKKPFYCFGIFLFIAIHKQW